MVGTLHPWPMVRQGDEGHPVTTLQYLLRARGKTITVDGVFGPRTAAAVRDWQRQARLAVDGIAGPHTWLTLIIEVRKEDKGDAVRGAQEEFRFRELSGDPERRPQMDGDFGPGTDAAVRAFQRAIHADVPSMQVDGIVGRMTWQALTSGMLSRGPLGRAARSPAQWRRPVSPAS